MLSHIGIGSNLGDRRKSIENAIHYLRETSGIKVKKSSAIYETEPVGGPEQPKYLNGVIEIETDLDPRELLLAMQKIEKLLGRKTTVENGPRAIDLDILTYDDRQIDEPDLKIPHPRMHERDFVQKPLRDILQP